MCWQQRAKTKKKPNGNRKVQTVPAVVKYREVGCTGFMCVSFGDTVTQRENDEVQENCQGDSCKTLLITLGHDWEWRAPMPGSKIERIVKIEVGSTGSRGTRTIMYSWGCTGAVIRANSWQYRNWDGVYQAWWRCSNNCVITFPTLIQLLLTGLQLT